VTPLQKSHIIESLNADILRLEGLRTPHSILIDNGLGPICQSLPNKTFPLGCVHEFIAGQAEDTAATQGFLGGLLSTIMNSNGVVAWISAARKLFPPALKYFGIAPERIIFIDLQKEKEVLWALEETLKCRALTAVVGEVKDISFTESRRLQLAVEQSAVTGFIVRSTKLLNTTACVSRWKISSLSSEPIEDLPGIGDPRWRVELLRIRNGKTGCWDVQWNDGKFVTYEPEREGTKLKRKTG
jgi:protein ImuA